MKIMFVTATLTSGGSERVISLLANKMAEKGHQIEVICLRKQIVFYPINSDVKITFAAREALYDSMPLKIVWLRKYIKSASPDIVISFMTAVYCTTIFALLGLNIPIIASERNDPVYTNILRKILRKIFLPMATHLVVQTENIKEYYSTNIQRKTSVIYNPVSEKVWEVSDIPKINQIISVGRLFPQKNQKMMIDAFSRIKDKYLDYKLVIYGEGPLRKELEKYIKSLSLEERVLLPGRNKEVISELKRSKLFCMSSDYEGMSNALIEAQCIGLPIITTRVSGAEELIVNHKNGIIVNIGDTDALTEAIDSLLSNEVKMNSFSHENTKRASLFMIDRIVDQWFDVITSIV